MNTDHMMSWTARSQRSDTGSSLRGTSISR